MADDSFFEAFDEIDTDGDGIVHYNDLVEYAKKDGVADDFPQVSGIGQLT